ncbi:hypothetical protein Pan54_05140 [Rubinisphaera italica]|uniref:Uncharacterized protein n=1 Tax=Rubinisphaera italica TaxID=2527969 RepID=A0A5C5XAH7_9PLAN|nr:hypothetical protein Pan54_05140 [Rubinisphaera italica]
MADVLNSQVLRTEAYIWWNAWGIDPLLVALWHTIYDHNYDRLFQGNELRNICDCLPTDDALAMAKSSAPSVISSN